MNKKTKPIKSHKMTKRYQKNKYFWFLIVIVILNVSVISYFVINFFAHQNKIETQIENKNLTKKELLDINQLKNLNQLNDITKQLSYLDSIKSGDIIKINDIKINFPQINQLINNKHKIIRTNFIPKLDLNDKIATEIYPYLLNNKIKDLEISSPIVDEKNVELKWSNDETLNKNSEIFLSNYLKLNDNELTLDLNLNKNSILNLNVPNIFKVKFLELVLQKYDIHNLKISFDGENDKEKIDKILDSLYILQRHLGTKKYNINFDVVLDNIHVSTQLSNNNLQIVKNILAHKINLNTFVLNFDAKNKQFLNNRLLFIQGNIISLKNTLESDMKKYKDIEFNDSTLNSFISLQINGESKNISYSVTDLTEISKLYLTYKFQKLYFNNVNIDTNTSNNDKSQFARYIFFEKLLNIVNEKEINRHDIYKIFSTYTNKKIDYSKQVKQNNLLKIPDYQPNTNYTKGDKVVLKDKVYEFISIYNSVTKPGILSSNSQWKEIGSTSELKKQAQSLKIEIIKHNGKEY